MGCKVPLSHKQASSQVQSSTVTVGTRLQACYLIQHVATPQCVYWQFQSQKYSWQKHSSSIINWFKLVCLAEFISKSVIFSVDILAPSQLHWTLNLPTFQPVMTQVKGPRASNSWLRPCTSVHSVVITATVWIYQTKTRKDVQVNG